MKRFSPAIFSATYCVAYVVVLLLDAPLFLYYPEIGSLRWHWSPLPDSGPAMAWYGIMAVAAGAALIAALLIPERQMPQFALRSIWILPAAALFGCAFLMRKLLLA